MLCMEWLGHIIHVKIDEAKWHPIRLSRSSLSLSNFFMDDLVISCKAKLGQAQLLAYILNHFCAFSRNKVSTRKSNVYFSKGSEGGTCSWISQLFSF